MHANAELRRERDYYASAETAKSSLAEEGEFRTPYGVDRAVARGPCSPVPLTGEERWPYAGHCLGMTVYDIVDAHAEAVERKQELDAALARIEANRKQRESASVYIQGLRERIASHKDHRKSEGALVDIAMTRTSSIAASEDVAAITRLLSRGARSSGACDVAPYRIVVKEDGRLDQTSWTPAMKHEFRDMARLLPRLTGAANA